MPGAARDVYGSPNVFVNDLPAVREGDMPEIADYNIVIQGASTVYVNDRQFAREGDPHTDGVIPVGSPDTYVE